MFRGVKLVPGRQAGTMPGTSDFELFGSWRVHKKALGVGERIESTIYGGLIFPTGQQTHDFFGDHKETNGFWGGAATGYISRTHYVWLGASYTGYQKSSRGDQRPSSLFYSAVYGFRPPFGKMDYPHWDLRFLAELTGEVTEGVDHHGFIVSNSKGHSIFLGPLILALFKRGLDLTSAFCFKRGVFFCNGITFVCNFSSGFRRVSANRSYSLWNGLSYLRARR